MNDVHALIAKLDNEGINSIEHIEIFPDLSRHIFLHDGTIATISPVDMPYLDDYISCRIRDLRNKIAHLESRSLIESHCKNDGVKDISIRIRELGYESL